MTYANVYLAFIVACSPPSMMGAVPSGLNVIFILFLPLLLKSESLRKSSYNLPFISFSSGSISSFFSSLFSIFLFLNYKIKFINLKIYSMEEIEFKKIEESLLDETLIIEEELQDHYTNSSAFSKMFFNWTSYLQDPDHNTQSKLPDDKKVELAYTEFNQFWELCDGQKDRLKSTLYQANKGRILFIWGLTALFSILMFVGPVLVVFILEYIDEEGQDYQRIALFLGVYIVSKVISAILTQIVFFYSFSLGNKIKGVLDTAIYRKSLKFSLLRATNYQHGDLINLMLVDTNKILFYYWLIRSIISFPILIVMAMFFMYTQVDIAYLAGFGAVLIFGFFNTYATKKLKDYNNLINLKKDKRMKLTSEIFNNIKIIKMNGWEKFFEKRLNKLREEEISYLKKSNMSEIFMYSTMWLTPMAITISIFFMFMMFGGLLTPIKAFSTISTFYMLQNPMREFALYMVNYLEYTTSSQRIEEFLLSNEINNDHITQQNLLPGMKTALSIKDGNFFWYKDKYMEQKRKLSTDDIEELNGKYQDEEDVKVLKDIGIEIRQGQLIGIFGKIGCGKSSLIYSLIGETVVREETLPSITIPSRISLVCQHPWIQNATIRDNILFGSKYDKNLYEEALQHSCLVEDLIQFPLDDLTMIGEKGATLSGGQKLRISLARALYQQRDLIILDDPLSALDAHVGKRIFQQTICSYLKGKTVILITHALYFAKDFDYIYVFDNGKIQIQGTFEEIEKEKMFKSLFLQAKIKQQKNQMPRIQYKQPSVKNFDENDSEVSVKSHRSQSISKTLQETANIHKEIPFSKLLSKYYRDWGGAKKISLLGLLMCFWLATNIGQNFYIGYWITSEKPDSFFHFSFYILLAALYGFFEFMRLLIIYKGNTTAIMKIHKQLTSSLLLAPITKFFDKIPVGEILTRYGEDLSVLDKGLPDTLQTWVILCYLLLAIIFISVYLSRGLALPVFIFYFYYVFWLNKKFQKSNASLIRQRRNCSEPIASYFSESLQGLHVIRAYRKEGQFIKKFQEKVNRSMAAYFISQAFISWAMLRMVLMSILMTIPILAFCLFQKGVWFTSSEVGVLLCFIIPIDVIAYYYFWNWDELQQRFIRYERLVQFTKIIPEKQQVDNITPTWPQQGEVKFDNLWVKYREGLPFVLKGLTFTVKAGEKIGVVGRTGAGKSTIILAILRVLEAELGNITIDGKNINNVNIQNLRQRLILIPQDPTLFEDKLRVNLDPEQVLSDDELWEVLKEVGLNETFQNRQGLDTLIKEKGENLSAGEKQLVCIARAFLKKSRILLIDEATSSIDLQSEQLVQQALNNLFNNCTILTIAHRLKTIINYDKILVIDNGEAAEFDSPKNLLGNKESMFYKMWQETLKQEENNNEYKNSFG